MRIKPSNARLLVALALLGLAMGCDSATGPDAGRSVSLSFGLTGSPAGQAPGPAAAAGLFAAGLELTDGVNTLVIESADLVMREIEFERVETAGCDSGLDNVDCEKFEIGPRLVPLPLDGSISQELSAQVDVGTYDEVEFELHKVEDWDVDFLTTHPDFAGISIRVTGTYNGQSFLYTSSIDEERELELTSPLVVTPDSGPVNVTLKIDLRNWFVAAGGMLIDPQTANDGQPNESVVTENIRFSIEGFRDDDHDGVSHDDDPDEA